MARPEEKLALTIKRQALHLGFDDVGITDAAPLERDEAAYRRWLEQGMSADMEWMRNGEERRAHPDRILPGCKSVVVVAKNVFQEQPERVDAAAGRVARYARGKDYHRIMDRDLKRLTKFIRELGKQRGLKVETKSNVDTGHVLERALAQRAGVGFQGKNTMLISKYRGSHLMLGEVFTTLELAVDPPEPPHCGTCTRCLEACPTDAFPEPWVLDARRCISYWTIEHRGDLPAEAALHGWIFGCDICQDVCPWNRFSEKRTDSRFEEWEVPPALDIREMAAISDMDFEARFYGTPVWRAHPEGMRRNARALAAERESQITGS